MPTLDRHNSLLMVTVSCTEYFILYSYSIWLVQVCESSAWEL